MRITHVGPDEIFHRYRTPKWASYHEWLRSIETHYLSRGPQTALEEYKAGR